MSDVENAYKQIASFLNNETEKTLLICGIADEEKHRALLKALNARGRSKGLIFLIHTTKDGMENFFRWAGLYKVKVPKKYGQSMQLSNLTIYFDNLSTKSSSNKYDNYAFDFMIVWPMQSVILLFLSSCKSLPKTAQVRLQPPGWDWDSLLPGKTHTGRSGGPGRWP